MNDRENIRLPTSDFGSNEFTEVRPPTSGLGTPTSDFGRLDGARRSRAFPWIPVGLLLIVFTVELLTMPTGYIYLDQVAWHEEARSIILNGSLAVDESVRKSTNWAYVVNDRDGRYYSKYGLFNGVVSVLPLALEFALTGDLPHETRDTEANPERILIANMFFAFVSEGIAFLLWLVSGWYIESQWKRMLFVLMTIYCTTLWHYLRFPLSESTQVGLFLLFWLFFLRFSRRKEPIGVPSKCPHPDPLPKGEGETEPSPQPSSAVGEGVAVRPRRDAYSAWFALFLLCQTRVADLFILPLFGAYLAWLAWQSDMPWRAKLRFVVAIAALPAVLIVAAQGLVHFYKFGSPFLSGYHQYWEPPNSHTVWQVLAEFAVHPQWSFFVTFPVLILALPGWWTYLRRHTAEAAFLLAVLLGMFDIVAPLPFWRGELAYGPRYFLYLLPVLSLPALYVLEWLTNPCRSKRAIASSNHAGRSGIPLTPALSQREREDFVGRGRPWVGRALLAGIVIAAVILAFAQFQVQRFGFFDWRGAFRNLAGGTPEAQSYFNETPVPKICWDHLRFRDHLEDLPYYRYLARDKTPEELAEWKRELLSHINYSNLYWFPDINK